MMLDPQRSQAIGIMLAKFGKRSPEDIAKAVRIPPLHSISQKEIELTRNCPFAQIAEFQVGALGVSEINSLRNLMPQKEEVIAIQACVDNTAGPPVKLGKYRIQGEASITFIRLLFCRDCRKIHSSYVVGAQT